MTTYMQHYRFHNDIFVTNEVIITICLRLKIMENNNY